MAKYKKNGWMVGSLTINYYKAPSIKGNGIYLHTCSKNDLFRFRSNVRSSKCSRSEDIRTKVQKKLTSPIIRKMFVLPQTALVRADITEFSINVTFATRKFRRPHL